MTIEFRQSSAADHGFITDILQDWQDTTDWMPNVYHPDELASLGQFLTENCDTKILLGPQGPVGFLAMKVSTIHGLFVAPSERGKGFGAVAIEQLKESFEELRLWVFEANVRAISFYENLGFQQMQNTAAVANEFDLPEREYRWRHHG